VICRISPKGPIALEKFDSIQQMGRFTLRDEGRTIAIGKVLKYKPYVKGVVGATQISQANASEITRTQVQIVDNSSKEMVYNFETGELSEKKNEPKLDQIAEEEDD